MTDILYTAIITEAPRINYLATPDVPVQLQGMFQTGLSADGSAPATHWVSSGYVSQDDIDLLATYGIEQYPNDLQGWDAINDAGLQIVQSET